MLRGRRFVEQQDQAPIEEAHMAKLSSAKELKIGKASAPLIRGWFQ